MRYYLKKYSFLMLFIALVFTNQNIYSQNISFLYDFLGNVLIFDSGKIKQIEAKKFKSYQIGDNSLAYEDAAGNFKIYYNNIVHNVCAYVDNYTVTKNLVVFSYNNVLKVFDSGRTVSLSLSAKEYSANSNIVVWYDDVEHILKAYYEGKIFELDDALTRNEENYFISGDNIAAFVDSRKYVNIFYQEEIIALDYYERFDSIKAGKNLVAFVEVSNNSFQCYYYGELTEIENFRANSYKTAENFLAYVDVNGYFKVFRDFQVETLSFNTPDFYYCKDNILVYGIQNNFYACVDSKVFTLENFYPDEIKISNNVCLYLDNLGNLKFFDGEKTTTISYEKVTNFELHGKTAKYSFGVNSEAVFWNGKTYNND